MQKLEQFRDPHLSLFQSAVDEVLARKLAVPSRTDPGHPMMQMAAAEAKTAEAAGTPSTPALAQAIAGGVADKVGYCATLARNYALAKLQGHEAEADRYEALLTARMGDCDPAWVETAIRYAEFLASKGEIPYRAHKNLSDFVIDGKLPAYSRVALLGDWGTGQSEANLVLGQIARKNPDVVIHMGDIYYSATDFEVETYFYKLWKSAFDLTKVATYTLAGNHDMFSGGAAYYKLLDQLGQPASYFCLRNDYWQFLAIDTGYYDGKPGGTDPTFLHDAEVAWLADKIQNRGTRRTVLLSHHQLFAAFEDICGKSLNDKLNGQLAPLLPGVDVWFWGHEHNLVVYKPYMGVLARCIGHGAFPIGLDEIAVKPHYPEVPVEPVRLGNNGTFYSHGYVIIDLAGNHATVSYYEDSSEGNPLYTESFGAAIGFAG